MTSDGNSKNDDRNSDEAPPATYRAAAAEIETILGAIERDRDLDVDALADQVERASSLIKFCYEKLESAEIRVKKVTDELGAGRMGEAKE